MSEVALTAAFLLPAVSFGGSGLALIGTRSRLTGVSWLVLSAGLFVGAVVNAAGQPTLAARLAFGLVLVAGSAAVLAYPRPHLQHWVEYCLWVTACSAGAIAAVLALFDRADPEGLALIVLLAWVGHGWWVLESGDDDDREAMLWLVLAAFSTALIALVLSSQFGATGAAASSIAAATIGPATVIGIRRPRLTDIRSMVVSVVVFGVVAVSYLSIFIGAMSGLETFGVTDPPVQLYATLGLLLAAGFHPLRVVLRGLVDELLFGDRPDPLWAAASVADRIGDEPVEALRAIREALVLPYACVSLDGTELATSGTAVTDTRRFPLLRGDSSGGEIVVGLRPGELALSRDDEQVLRIIGPLLAQTMRARALALDLKESRATAIGAIEEERRRLRRDLHDGLGPTLSGIAYAAAAARNSLTTDPIAAETLLQGVRSDAAAAVAEIRRLVYDMRPPALDELGLVAALRQQVGTTRSPSGELVQVAFDADELPLLTAAVEVAAYRIATEAVTNSARHSGTDQVRLTIEHDHDHLAITVRDAGVSGDAWVPGVGLSSMRERAAEVGGSLDITTNGTSSLVVARLPLA